MVGEGNIRSNDWKVLNDGIEDENATNNLEQPLLFIVSTLLRPPMAMFFFRQSLKHYCQTIRGKMIIKETHRKYGF